MIGFSLNQLDQLNQLDHWGLIINIQQWITLSVLLFGGEGETTDNPSCENLSQSSWQMSVLLIIVQFLQHVL